MEVRANWRIGVEGEAWQLVERFRPRFTVELAERWALFSELELALTQGRNQVDEIRRVVQASDLGPFFGEFGLSVAPRGRTTFSKSVGRLITSRSPVSM